jgi:hypothetical protein
MTTSLTCPFCGSPIEAVDVTEPDSRDVGLIFLRAKCIPCDTKFESAGLGMVEALKNMGKVLARRVGTKPGEWKIQPRKERPRKRRGMR